MRENSLILNWREIMGISPLNLWLKLAYHHQAITVSATMRLWGKTKSKWQLNHQLETISRTFLSRIQTCLREKRCLPSSSLQSFIRAAQVISSISFRHRCTTTRTNGPNSASKATSEASTTPSTSKATLKTSSHSDDLLTRKYITIL